MSSGKRGVVCVSWAGFSERVESLLSISFWLTRFFYVNISVSVDSRGNCLALEQISPSLRASKWYVRVQGGCEGSDPMEWWSEWVRVPADSVRCVCLKPCPSCLTWSHLGRILPPVLVWKTRRGPFVCVGLAKYPPPSTSITTTLTLQYRDSVSPLPLLSPQYRALSFASNRSFPTLAIPLSCKYLWWWCEVIII